MENRKKQCNLLNIAQNQIDHKRKTILKRAALGHPPRKCLHSSLPKLEEAASFSQNNAYNVFNTYLKFMLSLSATLIQLLHSSKGIIIKPGFVYAPKSTLSKNVIATEVICTCLQLRIFNCSCASLLLRNTGVQTIQERYEWNTPIGICGNTYKIQLVELLV